MKPRTFSYFAVSEEVQKAADQGIALAELQIVGLSTRTINILEDHKCVFLKDLLRYTRERVKAMNGMGDSAIFEIERAFKNFVSFDKRVSDVNKTTSKIDKYISQANSRVYLD
ncbi:MAG: DNA-directed RNA polymerase subunit alpha C-terminal domain-containing protein [bacterium]